jgi:hypothetical protein
MLLIKVNKKKSLSLLTLTIYTPPNVLTKVMIQTPHNFLRVTIKTSLSLLIKVNI